MKANSRVDIGLLILRVGLGLTILFFGSQKLLGVFGGPGYSGTIGFMSKMGIPGIFANLAIIAEFFGGLGLVFGLLTPVAAFGVACTVATAVFMNMREPGTLAGVFSGAKGADPSKLFFPGALFFMAIAVMILGAGRYSLDGKFFRKGR